MIEAGPVAYCLPGRINAIASSQGLRPRLPSLRSVVPSRHAFSLYLFAHESHECNEGTGGTGVWQNAPTRHLTPKSIKAFILLWIEAAFTQNFTPKNYTYPSLAGITG